jgi:hypothetical protein
VTLHTGRRRHGANIVCETVPVDGIRTWRVSAWFVADPAASIRLPTTINFLQFAQAIADALVREKFDHRCDVETCGQWSPLDARAETFAAMSHCEALSRLTIGDQGYL